MRRPRYIDFECPICKRVEEKLVETDENGQPLLGEAPWCQDDEGGSAYMMNPLETMKIGDVLGRTKYPVEEDVVHV